MENLLSRLELIQRQFFDEIGVDNPEQFVDELRCQVDSLNAVNSHYREKAKRRYRVSEEFRALLSENGIENRLDISSDKQWDDYLRWPFNAWSF